MDRSVISRLQERPGILAFFIAAITAIVLVLNGYGLSVGVTNVLPHLFYIPIILVAYFYARRGVLFACALSAIYCAMVFVIDPVFPGELLPAGGRVVLFVLIAAVVSFLTRRMRESERQFRGVAERSSDIIILTDPAGKALYVSPSVRKNLGWDPAEITGQTPQAFIHPEDIGVLQTAVPQIIRDSRTVEVLVRMRKKDGDYATIEFSGSPVIHAGLVTGMQVVGRDITARKQAEDELRDANRRLADIIDFLPDSTMVIDAEGKVVAWNRALENLTGIPAMSVLGKGDYPYAAWFYGEKRPVLIDLVLRDDQDTIAVQYPRHRRVGHTIFAEAETVRPDGSRIKLWITATP